IELIRAAPVLPPEIAAGMTDRADQPRMQLADFILPLQIREKDFMCERFGIHLGHLELAHGDGDEEAEIALVQLSEFQIIDAARRCDRRLDLRRWMECRTREHARRIERKDAKSK